MISKRAAGHLVEHALTLNIDELIRAGGLRPRPTSGQLSWAGPLGQSSSVNFEACLAISDGYLLLNFEGQGGPELNHQVRQTITLVTTKPHFGGTRWWFICPVTGERVGRLHLPPGSSEFASRVHHDLTYACQTEDVHDRAARRARKLKVRLGDTEPRSPWMPLKPKGMRWTTYNRYAGQIEAFEKVADLGWVKLVGRWMARGLL
jgi:hypothetical protein